MRNIFNVLFSITFFALCLARVDLENQLFGFSLSEWQNSGSRNCGQSNWSEWEKGVFPDGKPHIEGGKQSGKATNFMNEYAQDILFLKNTFNINALRISVSWEFIEPQPGIFNQEALQHYANICKFCKSLGIEVMITLHHFVHPLWFEKKGGFESEANIFYFVRFAQQIFKTLKPHVKLWCTINEPGIVFLQGYMRGVFPPGKTSPAEGLTVLRNLLKAHVMVYAALKPLAGSQVKIGLSHQYLIFESYNSFNPLEFVPCNYLNQLINQTILDFLKTGNVGSQFSSLQNDTHAYHAKDDLGSKFTDFYDFVGLNYYSRVILRFSFSQFLYPTCFAGETMTDMPYAIYGKGLYDAIKDVSSLGKPIYVTENGIADAQDNRRATFLRDYLGHYLKALRDGFDVRGYFYWTAYDNFEWDMAYGAKFGACYKDAYGNRIMRPGSKIYAQFIDALRS